MGPHVHQSRDETLILQKVHGFIAEGGVGREGTQKPDHEQQAHLRRGDGVPLFAGTLEQQKQKRPHKHYNCSDYDYLFEHTFLSPGFKGKNLIGIVLRACLFFDLMSILLYELCRPRFRVRTASLVSNIAIFDGFFNWQLADLDLLLEY